MKFGWLRIQKWKITTNCDVTIIKSAIHESYDYTERDSMSAVYKSSVYLRVAGIM